MNAKNIFNSFKFLFFFFTKFLLILFCLGLFANIVYEVSMCTAWQLPIMPVPRKSFKKVDIT